MTLLIEARPGLIERLDLWCLDKGGFLVCVATPQYVAPLVVLGYVILYYICLYVLSFALGQFVKPRKRSARTERLPRLPAVLTFPRPVSPERHMRMTLSIQKSCPVQPNKNQTNLDLWFRLRYRSAKYFQVWHGMTVCILFVQPELSIIEAFTLLAMHLLDKDTGCVDHRSVDTLRYFWDHRHCMTLPSHRLFLSFSHQTAPSNSPCPRCFSWRCWLPWIITCISFGLRPAARDWKRWMSRVGHKKSCGRRNGNMGNYRCWFVLP